MTDTKTPFDYWWAIYASPRKGSKKACKGKFNAFDIDEQRLIYKHTQWCLQNHPDWKPDGATRPYMQGAEVYLNQKSWEGWEPPTETGGRPATIKVSESDAQKMHGLQKLQEAAEATGQKNPEIQKQIDEMIAKFGGTQVG